MIVVNCNKIDDGYIFTFVLGTDKKSIKQMQQQIGRILLLETKKKLDDKARQIQQEVNH